MHMDLLQPSFPIWHETICWRGWSQAHLCSRKSHVSWCQRAVLFTHLLPSAALARQTERGSWTRRSNPTPPPPHISHTFSCHPLNSWDQHWGTQRLFKCPNAIRALPGPPLPSPTTTKKKEKDQEEESLIVLNWAFLDPDCHPGSGQLCPSLGVLIDWLG